ncbi:uncharacterized membrane protein YhaH (DUF805 family) [Kitasatospora sp. MAP12-15]|uniref:DUF805 domain-containing protein n=1 Tax=unclassified Kitasatospora TaxID=2633591 RepID=UPI0024766082|nr:DUF805 domain-containing protein [Kitasatospora sp. MAP12-44]MDH6112409.1 uncharacterized membrane protein YhaH (DUF805 family) [Kitasatospora sp. MAP12-44]
MDWYLAVLKNYAGFSGRARRKEYWMFTLFNTIAMVVAEIIDAVLGTTGIITGIYVLAVLLPMLAVAVRRLHDTGRSGWWLLIGAIPFIGGIILLVFTVSDGQPSDNQYGPNPKLNAAQG